METNLLKRVLIAVTRCAEKLAPKAGIILPAQTQLAAVRVRNLRQLLGREVCDNARYSRRHAERELRYAPIRLDVVPCENHYFLHQRLGDRPGPISNGLGAAVAVVFNSIARCHHVSFVKCTSRITNGNRAARLMPSKSRPRPQLSVWSDARHVARKGARCDVAQEPKSSFVKSIDGIERIPAPSIVPPPARQQYLASGNSV